MPNKINLITGETYTLGELFSGNRQIIIPDLQRDYCWGNPENNLVEGFIGNLLEQFCKIKQSDEKLNFGLIYGYETPADHIQLCDGQQRITTIFLLLGMLNRKCQAFRQYLIPDAKYKSGDKEPYVNYAIRETSLYFLADLVEHFFIDSSSKQVNDIRNADWYFADYDLDPSIQSMFFALAVMEKWLSQAQINFVNFGKFLCNNLTFQYYDMLTRKNGEETFVIINTTGEPLTPTQNLKPLVINAGINNKDPNLARYWEEIETWFWKNRNLNNGNDTADAGMDEFLRWVTMIENAEKRNYIAEILETGKYSFPYDEISFEKVRSYWKTIVWLKENGWLTKFCSNGNDCLSPKNGRISQIDCFVLLAILKFACYYQTKLANDQEIQLNLNRVYEFFANLARLDSVSKNVNDLVAEALRFIEIIIQNGGDPVSLLKHEKELSERLLNNEEKRKLAILSVHQQRNELEKSFWSAQEHKIWNGEIMPLIAWATTPTGFDMQKFTQYLEKFKGVFVGNCDGNIDKVRRALLTLGLFGYPRVFYGYTKISFGWDWSDWKILIKDNQDQFKKFFDRLIMGETLDQMIENYNGDSIWKCFIKDPELLAYCGQKKVQRTDNNLLLLTKERKSAEYRVLIDFFVSDQA